MVVASFASAPAALAERFLFPHVHADATDGRTLLQLVAPDEALRIDVFGALGGTMARATLTAAGARVVSCEDLAARLTALVLGIARGRTVDPKHARDFEALARIVDEERAEEAWLDHRSPGDPVTFSEGVRSAREAVARSPARLVPAVYEVDATAACPKCRDTGPFRVAERGRVLGLLGYC